MDFWLLMAGSVKRTPVVVAAGMCPMVQAPRVWIEMYGVYVNAPTVARVHVVRMSRWTVPGRWAGEGGPRHSYHHRYAD